MAELSAEHFGQVVLDGIGIGAIAVDGELNVTRWNSWMTNHMRTTAQQVLGKSIVELYPSLADRGQEKLLRQALADGMTRLLSPLFHQYFLPIAIGNDDSGSTRHMIQSTRIIPLKESDQVIGLLLLIEDYTERMNFEEELENKRKELEKTLAELDKTQRELVEAEKLKALVETAGAAAHEVSQPLQAILAFHEIALAELPAGHPTKEPLEKVVSQVERISNVLAKMRRVQRYATIPYTAGTRIVDFDSTSD